MADRRRRLAHLTTVDISLVYLLGTELRFAVEAGHEVFGISAPGDSAHLLAAMGVTHVPVPSLSRAWDLRADTRATRDLFRTLRALDLDVLHTHTPKPGVLGRLLGHAAGIPVVVNTCHGLWAAPDDRLARRAFVYGAEAVASRGSDADLFQNGADRETMAHFVRGTPMSVVGNGIDLDHFRRDPEAGARVRAELGVGPDEVLVGGVGRLVAEKGIVELGVAARELAGTARFVWAGPEEADKGDRIAGAVDGVELLGMRTDMVAVYSALDVFVLPSHREGFARSAMEAAACGCAVLLSDIRGCREIGTHDVHVRLVPPQDPVALAAALRELVADPGLRARLGAAARERALTTFDQRAVATASLETYDRVALRKRLGWAPMAPPRPHLVPPPLAELDHRG
ncbi:MAG TPA: glycosyltransferase family 4 protein [Iamia sp.]